MEEDRVMEEEDEEEEILQSTQSENEEDHLEFAEIEENSRSSIIQEESSIKRQCVSSTVTAETVPQFHFSGTKAGMEGVDKSHIDRIIAQVSKGNPYYEKAAKTDERVRERALAIKKKAASLTAKELSVAEIEVNKRVSQLEKHDRDFSRIWVVVDMDQFFVAVEMRDNPKLKGKPVAVGMNLISTASYEARKFGVRSAMPTFIGRKLCPELIVVPTRYDAYSEASKRAQSVFAEFDPNFSAMSMDEAFLDISHRLNGLTLESEEGIRLAEQIVQEMRHKVFQETDGLTCSAGIAPTRMLAKICSEKNKPNGQLALKAQLDVVIDFVHRLPVRKIPGIGKASELMLDVAFDVTTCADLWEKRFLIHKCCTPAIGDFYLRVPLAATDESKQQSQPNRNQTFFGFVGDNQLIGEESSDRKSISIERTFRAISNEKQLKLKCQEICEALAEEVAEKNVFGRTVTLKLKTDTFEVRTRGDTLKTFFGGKEITGAYLYRLIEPLLRQELPISARLVGIRLSNLGPEPANFDSSVYRQPVMDNFIVKGSLPSNGESTSNINNVTSESLNCPVCGMRLSSIVRSMSNVEINKHIDSCLNQGVLLEMTKTTEKPTTHQLNTKSKIDGYFVKKKGLV